MPGYVAFVVALVLAPFVRGDCTNKEFGKCGGKDFEGDTCCPSFDNCTYINDYYSQCKPKDLCLTPMYGQCAGQDDKGNPWTEEYGHQQCCPPSFKCSFTNQYYSQCIYDPKNSSCAQAYKQCGGKNWKGPKCCVLGFKCTPDNDYYSGCKAVEICTNPRFGQCGGKDSLNNPWDKEHKHDTCCPDGFRCEFQSQYYSQCKPNKTATDIVV